MRYHYQKPDIYLSMYGELYICNHPVYDRCTLFTIGDKGLAVIQQRFSADTKSTYWTEVDSWLTDSLYLYPKFKEYFDSRSGECTDGLYPTVTIRQIMWALKMKPIQRQRWELALTGEIFSDFYNSFYGERSVIDMDKYEEAVRIVNNYIRGLKECYENACDIVGDKSKTPAVRAKHARNAEEFYTLYNEVNCILQDIISLDESKEES